MKILDGSTKHHQEQRYNTEILRYFLPSRKVPWPLVSYGIIIYLSLALIQPSYAQKQATFNSNPEDEIALALYIGTTRAAFEICNISTTSWNQTDKEIIATARYIAAARYRQLKHRDSESSAEQTGYESYLVDHKLNPSMPACKIYQREIDALTWSATIVGAKYIQYNENHPNAGSGK